jgi:hypothetical protein
VTVGHVPPEPDSMLTETHPPRERIASPTLWAPACGISGVAQRAAPAGPADGKRRRGAPVLHVASHRHRLGDGCSVSDAHSGGAGLAQVAAADAIGAIGHSGGHRRLTRDRHPAAAARHRCSGVRRTGGAGEGDIPDDLHLVLTVSSTGHRRGSLPGRRHASDCCLGRHIRWAL